MSKLTSILKQPLAALALGALLLAGTANAAGPLNVSVDDNVLSADLQVAGGFSAKLTVTFEDVVGLSAQSLNISATAVDPTDGALLSRLGLSSGAIPTAFPMLVQIEPDPARGLSFAGTVNVELYTHDLEFVAASPLRLYSAPLGGAFTDVTSSHGAGSYRSGGTKGNFSEFMIVVETRTPLQASGDKLAALRTMLNGYSADMDADTYDELSGLLSAAESAFAANSLVAAVTYAETFADAVEDEGSAIPNVWGASHNLENVSGRLRAAAATLRFSLTLALNNS
ncbi:MAG: hypothetical protein HKN35_09090 [Woeseia sp.]|nr:hypothetical protein [Woeseia sp.]NNE61037.1 hypothetical protein [Woeseia sp.]NNL55714.1 hypothetical protein [Woeseia sp.]